MIKTVFIDYTGTMVREDDPYSMELLKIFVSHSDLKDPKEAFATVWGIIKKTETDFYKDSFLKKDAMVDYILNLCVKKYGLDYDLDKMHDIWRDSWIHAPLYDDVKPFFERIKLPIYIVTNNDLIHVEQSMAEKGLSPSGIISAEFVKACKPHREILDEGLRIAGVLPEQAVLIGDSESSDVACAQEVGVVPILLDRDGKSTRDDIRVIRTLDEF